MYEELTAKLLAENTALKADLIECGYSDGSICTYCAKDGRCDIEADEYAKGAGGCFEWRGPKEAD